jgi:hypothetical protein
MMYIVGGSQLFDSDHDGFMKSVTPQIL